VVYRVYTIREVAEILQVNQMTVRRRIKAGELKAELIQGKNGKQYLIQAEELERYQATETVEVVKMQYPVKLEDIDQRLQVRDKQIIDILLERLDQLMEKVERLEKQNRGRSPRIWNGKRKK
jgi:excisionase family DNA binding protein